MTALTIIQGLAKNVGMEIPEAAFTSSLRDMKEAIQYLNEAGRELSRRVDWGALQRHYTFTGDGTSVPQALPTQFARLIRGTTIVDGTTVIRPLTQQEWRGLTLVVGTPRFFLLEGSELSLFPFLDTGETVSVYYISKNWATGAGGDAPEFVADADTAIFDEDLLLLALIVRWRRAKGLPYEDYEAELEATLSALAGFDDRARF